MLKLKGTEMRTCKFEMEREREREERKNIERKNCLNEHLEMAHFLEIIIFKNSFIGFYIEAIYRPLHSLGTCSQHK